MKDFRIALAQTILPVTSMSPIRGFLPPAITIYGQKMDLVEEVLYNNVLVEEFVITSPTSIIIRIPDSQVGKPFSTVQALAQASLAGANTAVSLRIKRPTVVEGLDRLIQAWLLLFFTTPGSSVFSPDSGGGGSTLIGRSTDKQGVRVSVDLAQGIEKTSAELIKLQEGKDLPLEEKLRTSSLDSAEFDSQTSELRAIVSITNFLGDSAQVKLR